MNLGNFIIIDESITSTTYYRKMAPLTHFSKSVRAWLNEKFADCWIGRGGPISCAPRSPDLSPLDFFVGSYQNEYL
jgi:hypothetical protein